MADGLFSAVADSGFEVGVIPVPDGTHRVGGSEPSSIIVAGFDSYAYLGETGAAVIHPEG